MDINGEFHIQAELRGINEIRCVFEDPPEGCTFAFYVYRNGKDIGHYAYQRQAEVSYWAQEPGSYRFKVFIRDAEGHKTSQFSTPLLFENSREICCNIEPPRRRFDWLRNVGIALSEIWVNRKRLYRISLFNYRTLNKDAYLGDFWNILNPLIQIATYWFVFGIGLRAGKPVDDFPFLVWMLCGMIPWFFMAPCITRGAGAIRKRGIIALKMRYPVVTMPLEEVLVAFYNHLVMLGVLLVIFAVFGIPPSIYWLNLIYYMFFTIVFFTALGMATSVISMIALDFQKLVASLIRLLFYLTPILWSTERLSETAKFVLKLNPCLYIVNGYRDSLLYHVPFYTRWGWMAFFWGITAVLLVIGCNLQMKYRKYFLDME